MKSLNVLLIEDNPGDAFLIEEMLNASKDWKFQVVKAITLKQALEKIRNNYIEVIIADLGLPDSQGIATVDAILNHVKSTPIIVLTGMNDEQTGNEAVIRGAQDYLIKWNINPDQLMRSISYSYHRKKVEEKLIESEEKFRVIVEASPDAVITLDLNCVINYASKRAADIFGFDDPGILTGMEFEKLVAPEHHERIKAKREKLFKEDTLLDVLYILNRKGGSRFYGEVSSSLIINKEGEPEGIISIIKDITERKNSEMAIKAYQENLRSMASELNLAEEKERRKIAVDLHDDLGQTLAMTRIKLSAIKSLNKDPEISEHLAEMEKHVTHAIKNSRSLTYELSPPVLYEFGLAAAINWKLEQLSNEHKIETSLEVTDELPELREDLLILLFRAVGELLNNIVKHAQAKNVKVTFNMDGKCLNILVTDDGKGFDAKTTEDKKGQTSSIGLFSLRERLEYFDGTLTIDSSEKKGTKVYITLPVIFN
ncbi:MAG: PAS domain S-box protein [Prolixibacteraceae bacterium]|nr:PAS domain S-box protein [Prolixibacteraceae bacterium]MBN2775217.1 PAS domain S-box protein [Prolixibacteraceae bacterium]